MKKSRRKFATSFKTKVVLEALKERSSLQELSVKFDIAPAQISAWKKEFLSNAEKAFEGEHSNRDAERELERDELFKQIGQMKMENDWLKKKLL